MTHDIEQDYKRRVQLDVDYRNTFACGDEQAQSLAMKHMQPRNLGAQIIAFQSPYAKIRAILAARPDLDILIQKMLLSEPSPMIRRALAMNPTVDHQVLQILAGDKCPDVSLFAKETLAEING